MANFFCPHNYTDFLTIKETQIAIKLLKYNFEEYLTNELSLMRVSAPLFVFSNSGLNDNLNGKESPVSFKIPDINGECVEIIHSLAKWKRLALKKYKFDIGTGLYTNMNAIRREEKLDNLHSIYVDQWDWEIVIDKQDRTIEKLQTIVNKIYTVFKKTEQSVLTHFPKLSPQLPEEILFITSQQLENMYPNICPEEREHKIAEKYRAVFIMQIGKILMSGNKHGNRAPDYDDWELNGDIIFWSPILNRSIELSSMGIRVDEKALKSQLNQSNCNSRLKLPFHQELINGNLPYTIGGGIGQSRLCMYLLQKLHIGQVQSSIWDSKTTELCKQNNIELL